MITMTQCERCQKQIATLAKSITGARRMTQILCVDCATEDEKRVQIAETMNAAVKKIPSGVNP